MNHPWFNDFPWKDLYSKKVETKFIPRFGDNFDKKYCDMKEQPGEATSERYAMYLKEESFSNAFFNYTFLGQPEETQQPDKKLKIPGKFNTIKNKPSLLRSIQSPFKSDQNKFSMINNHSFLSQRLVGFNKSNISGRHSVLIDKKYINYRNASNISNVDKSYIFPDQLPIIEKKIKELNNSLTSKYLDKNKSKHSFSSKDTLKSSKFVN